MSIDEHFDAEDYLEGDEEETRCFINDAINDGYYQCEQGIESCQIAKDLDLGGVPQKLDFEW